MLLGYCLPLYKDDIVATFSSGGVNDTGIKLSMYRKICTLYRVVLTVFGIGQVRPHVVEIHVQKDMYVQGGANSF